MSISPGAVNSTPEANDVPENKNPADALANLYREACHLYKQDEDRHIEPRALTEYLIVVAGRLLGSRGEEAAPIRSKEITRRLSPHAKSALSGRGGVSKCRVSYALLTRDSQNETYLKDGERKFANHGPTIYDLGYYTKAAYQAIAEHLDDDVAEWAEAAEMLVIEDDDSALRSLVKSSLVKKL